MEGLDALQNILRVNTLSTHFLVPIHNLLTGTHATISALMVKIETLRVRTDRRTQLVDVTSEVQSLVAKSGIQQGICHVYVPHTTPGVTTTSTQTGRRFRFRRHHGPLIPNAAHTATLRAIPIRMQDNPEGTSQSIFIEHGRLVLGRGKVFSSANTTAARTHHADQDYPRSRLANQLLIVACAKVILAL